MSVQKYILGFVFASMMLGALCVSPRLAAADLMISPLRVVFKDRQRSATISLINTGSTANTYRVQWKMMKMDERGAYHDLEIDPNDKTAVPNMVIFTPRQVTVEPGGQQVVRLSLRRPAEIANGEYRGHISFSLVDTGEKGSANAEKKKGQSIRVRMLPGFSVPVIVRIGEDAGTAVSFADVKLVPPEQNRPHLGLGITLNRDAGTFSAYGTVRVYWTPEAGSEREIGILNNVALYPEMQRRTGMVVPLSADNISNGKLRVMFIGKYESANKIWAETVIPVSG